MEINDLKSCLANGFCCLSCCDCIVQTLILVDNMDHVSLYEGEVCCLWDGYEEEAGSVISLLAYCERNADRLRDKYCQLVYDVGQYEIRGKRIVEHFTHRCGLSLWWMSLLMERSLWKSSSITDAIRLLAFEELVLKYQPDKIILNSSNFKLNEVLVTLSHSLGIAYEWKRYEEKNNELVGLKTFFNRLPHVLQAVSWGVRFVAKRWKMRGQRVKWAGGDKNVFFCSYFFNFEQNDAEQGKFSSRYWGALIDLMKAEGFSVNWLQIYYPHKAVGNVDVALKLAKGFNHNKEVHGFLDSALSLRVVWKVASDWLVYSFKARKLRSASAAFRSPDTNMSLWPVLKNDWYSSIKGAVLIHNLFWVELFDSVLRDAPFQKSGYYLCENQGWERALIYLWKKHEHGHLYAVPHSTRSFWDLRFYRHQEWVQAGCFLPEPEFLIVNGEAARDAFLKENYAPDTLLEGEALRYLCLSKKGLNSLPNVPVGRQGKLRLLILGDYDGSSMVSMLGMMEGVKDHLPKDIEFFVKPHPNCQLDTDDFPALNLRVEADPMEKALQKYDVVFSSHKTSAAIDAFISGKRVVIVVDRNSLNISPLRGYPGLDFIRTQRELLDTIMGISQYSAKFVERPSLFFLDPDLPRWRHLLGVD